MSTIAALTYERYGDAETVLSLASVDRPTIADDEVLIRVRAAAVSPGDAFALRGEPYLLRLTTGLRRPKHPVLGLAVAGTVEQAGPAVVGLDVGADVCAEVPRGGFAEYVAAPVGAVVRMPSGLGFEQAAAVPVAGVTALQALRDVAHVQPGQHVLVTGASGGVGTFAVQIARMLGAQVTAVCGPDAATLVAGLGADHVIDYTRDGLAAQPGEYDVVFDNVGAWPLRDLRRALKPSGVLMPNSNTHGGRWVGGYLWRAAQALAVSPFTSQRLRPFAARADGELLAEVLDLVEQGAVTPVVDRVFSLAEAPAALAYYGQGHAHGRVVVTVADSRT